MNTLRIDYDRLHFCQKATQLKWFEKQLELSDRLKKPLFLHLREYSGDGENLKQELHATDDFIDIIKRNKEKVESGGVVHSFTGSVEELERLLRAGFGEITFY